MSRVPVETTIAGLKVKSAPLKFETAQPMLPDATQFVARAIKEIFPLAPMFKGGKEEFAKMDDKAFIEMIVAIIPTMNPSELAGLMQMINRNAHKVLSSTTVVMPDVKGDPELKNLSKEKDRADVFDEHPQAYIPLVVFAGRVTFARFFPELGRRGGATQSASS